MPTGKDRLVVSVGRAKPLPTLLAKYSATSLGVQPLPVMPAFAGMTIGFRIPFPTARNQGVSTMLRIGNLTKAFGAEEALKSVSMEIEAGEIHGLVGVNGSGKSTLLNILFGNPAIGRTGGYSGAIYLDGERANISRPSHAVRLGIGMIHQEFALIPGLTVSENIKMGREKVCRFSERVLGRSFSRLDHRRNREDARLTLGRMGIDIDPGTYVSDLSISMKQFVEIAREVDNPELKVLLLDEPTAALNREDSFALMEILKDLARRGAAILYVSHRLEEVVSLCERISVLRDGEISAVFSRAEFDADAIAENMIGRKFLRVSRASRDCSGEPVAVSMRDFSVDMPGERLRGVNLDVRSGEILGVTGLSGHGKLALGVGIMGLFPSRGNVSIKGRLLEKRCASQVISNGVAFLPEDRRTMGLLLDHSVMDNIVFSAVQNKGRFLRRFPLSSLRFLDRKKARLYAEECVGKLGIKCRSVFQKVKELSGGNQQKVCIARSLALEPEILFISEPTRGIDIGAKEIILDILVKINARQGTTIIMASSELEEMRRLCDRIAVLYRGAVFDVLPPGCDDKLLARRCCGEKERAGPAAER